MMDGNSLFRISSQKGAVSVAYTMAVIIILFVIASALLTMVGGDSRSASNKLLESKAFYAAESGLEMALGELKNGGDGLLSGVSINGMTVNTTLTNDTILTATATGGSISRSVQVVIERSGLPQVFNYMVASFSPTKKLDFKGNKSPYLKGKVFSLTQDKVRFKRDWVLDNVDLYVTQGTNVINETSYTYTLHEFAPGSPPISLPSLNTQYYNNYLSNIGNYSEYGEDEIENDLNLSSFPDGVLFRNDKLEIEDGCTITGPGVIVATKDIEIEDGATIGPDVVIISGKKLKVKDGSTITGMSSVLFGLERVEIKDAYTSVSGSIISPDRVKIDSHKDLDKRGLIQGIIFANRVDIKKAKIYGSIIGNAFENEDDGDTKIDSAYLVFDQSYLPSLCPPGFQNQSSLSVKNGTWRDY